jgi:ribonuclease HI
MREPARVFTDHIETLTDRMSSIKAMESRKISLQTHPFVYECKQKCWQLARSHLEVSFMWVPAHVGVVGNERADFEARQATLVMHNRLLEMNVGRMTVELESR